MPSPSPRDVSDYLLDLHCHANELGYRDLQKRAFARMRSVVPYDSALMAAGTLRDGVPFGHDVLLERKEWDFMESWDLVKHEDRIAVAAMTNPGATLNHHVHGGIFDGCPGALAHCARYGLEYVLCTAIIDPRANHYSVLSIYRGPSDPPFTETERAATEIMVPHVFAAARNARIGQLRAATHVSDSHGHSSAIVNDEGLLLEYEQGIVELLRAGWKDWNGPWLPRELWDQIRSTQSSRVVHGPIVIRADAADGVRLLHVRRTVIGDHLTAREREIALAFSGGETYREIGARLGITPNTVRRHLGNIYGKLGISSKVELDRMVSGLT